MEKLLASYKKLYSQLKSGTQLPYLSGAGSVTFKSYDEVTGNTIVERDGSEITIQAEKIKQLVAKLCDGEPLHVDTFLAASGNARTIIETLVAHLPEVGSKKIDHKKHLQAFPFEIHRAGTTILLGGDDWLSPEWALAILFYEWDKSPAESGLSKSNLKNLLAATTQRSADSWNARLENLKAAVTGKPFDGGEQTREKSREWLSRFASAPEEIRELARHAFTETADSDLLATVCVEFNIEVPQLSAQVPKSDLMLALCAKPFAIITGTSGTGKTREAQDFAARLRTSDQLADSPNVAVVAVGADWTDNRNVVGFVNHMRTFIVKGEERPAFQATPVVDLLLQARLNPNVPHVLILDEMNLSHVERYFSDFLSAMETRDGFLQLHSEGSDHDNEYVLARFDGDEVGVPRRVRYPENLFIVGTVNVDETTYMFSPKVLDRAHVLEFVMHEEELRGFLATPQRPPLPARSSVAAARAFLQLSRDCRQLAKPLPTNVAGVVEQHLVEMFRILREGRFEFGYRSTAEVLAYMIACCEIAPDDAKWNELGWKADFDKVVLQKVLPRIHGSRVKIGGMVAALADYCTGASLESAMAYLPARGSLMPTKSLNDFLSTEVTDAAFPKSAAKLRQMCTVLMQDQFTSFIC